MFLVMDAVAVINKASHSDFFWAHSDFLSLESGRSAFRRFWEKTCLNEYVEAKNSLNICTRQLNPIPKAQIVTEINQKLIYEKPDLTKFW